MRALNTLAGIFILSALATLSSNVTFAQAHFVSFEKASGNFPISVSQKSSPVYVDPGDYAGVIRAMNDFKGDVERVTQAAPELITDRAPSGKNVIIAGTFGKSKYIDELIAAKKINAADLKGKWEKYVIQVIDNPLPGVDRALVIAGSDKRGTIF